MIYKLLSLKLACKDNLKYLLPNYKVVEEFLHYSNENNLNILKQIYSYKTIVEDILYQEDKVINLDNYKINITDLGNLFYLDLLLSENQNIVNYSYSVDFIKKIYDSYKKDKDIKKLIISKIINDIINNYQLNSYCQKKLIDLNNESKDIIRKDIHLLKDLNVDITFDEFISKRIDDIYKTIIMSLIKNIEKIKFERINEIFNQLGLNNIDITNDKFEEILKFLDKNNPNDITLLSKEDLFNEKKINLLYILLKYIFKDRYYIYNVHFLIKTRKVIINLLKSNQVIYSQINNSKLKYIIEVIVDSKYYLKNEDESDYMKLEELLKYYKAYYSKSKEKDIENIEDIIKNKKRDYEKYLKDFQDMKEKIEIIDYLFDLKNTEKEDEKKKIMDKWNHIEKIILDKKISKMRSDYRKKLIKYFCNNKEKIIKIYNEDIYNSFINLVGQKEEKKKDEIMNIIGEEPPPLIDKPHNQNESKNNSKQISNEKSEKSTKQYSSSNEKNNSINRKKNEVLQDKGDSAPLPEQNIMRNDISHISYNILNSSSIIIKVVPENGKNDYFFDEITYGKMNTKIDVNKFAESLRINKENNKDGILRKNYQLLIAFLDEFRNKIVNEYKNTFKLKIKLDLKNEEKDIDGIYNITCKYIFFQPYNNKPLSFTDQNILINKTNSLTNGFQFLIYEINNECYGVHLQNNEDDLSLNNQRKNENNGYSNKNILVVSDEIDRTADEDIIIEPIKIIDKDAYYNGNIKELENGYFIFWRNDNTIVLCDNNFDIIMEIKETIELITNIIERVNYDGKKKDSIQIVVSGSSDIILIIIDLKKLKYEIKGYSLSNMHNLNIIEMKKNNYIMAGKKNCIHTIDLFISNQIKQNKIDEKTYIGAYRVSDNIIALSSNSLLPGGEDNILFYNTNTKKTTNGIEDDSYISPIISSSGLNLISTEQIIVNAKKNKKNEKKRILLCASKSYIKKKQNGILIINANLGDNKKIEEPFYNTGNFEVNCFCPISNVINNEEKDHKNDILLEETNLFFVGGFDIEKRQGIIQLYKVIFEEKTVNTKIEYLQDIITDNIDSPINCIIQSKKKGNILATSYNGNIYLFTRPNIDFYWNKKNAKT